jgi:predicted CoA-binding protein
MPRTQPDIFAQSQTIAVVGLSSDPLRPSFGVSQYMQRQGYRIIPVNPKETQVLGETAYPSLEAIPAEIQIDIVNVFRRPEQTPAVATAAIARQAKVLWLQSGITNQEAAQIAQSAGLDFIEDQCIMVQHRRLPRA